jgi:heme/copper-type cytochrome/quinol oxidase subunit 2
MIRTQIRNYLPVGLLLVLGGSFGFSAVYFRRAAPRDRSFTITARQYAYNPSTISVNKGDRVQIRLASTDVTHGFYLEGYDIDAKVRREDPTFWLRHPSEKGAAYQPVEEISFMANRAGKFHYRCSITCGYMHPFMNGVLIVRPNYLYPTGAGLSLGLVAGMLLVYRRASARGQP